MYTSSDYRWLLIALALALGACAGATGVDDEGSTPLPDFFRILGDANDSETVGGTVLTADCYLDIIVDLTVPAPGSAEPGRFGGEVGRTVLRPDGSGLGLFADVAGAVDTRLIPPDSVEIVFPENQGDSGSRFWDSLAILGGRVVGGAIASGEWTCAPFDIDRGDFADTAVTAIGSWHLEPRDERPLTQPPGKAGAGAARIVGKARTVSKDRANSSSISPIYDRRTVPEGVSSGSGGEAVCTDPGYGQGHRQPWSGHPTLPVSGTAGRAETSAA